MQEWVWFLPEVCLHLKGCSQGLEVHCEGVKGSFHPLLGLKDRLLIYVKRLRRGGLCMLSSTVLLKGGFTLIRDFMEECKQNLFRAEADVLVERR